MQSTSPHIHSENKFSIFWHKSFIPRLGTSTEVFSNYQTKQFGVSCRKLHSTYPEKRFDENSFFQKLGIILSLTDFEWNLSCLPAEKLLHDCRNCTYLSRLHLNKNLCRSFCRFFSFVLHFDRLIFCRIFFGCVVKTALFCASGTNWGKYCFEKMYKALTTFGHQGTSFRPRGVNSSQFRQLCILFVRRNISD